MPHDPLPDDNSIFGHPFPSPERERGGKGRQSRRESGGRDYEITSGAGWRWRMPLPCHFALFIAASSCSSGSRPPITAMMVDKAKNRGAIYAGQTLPKLLATLCYGFVVDLPSSQHASPSPSHYSECQ